jgi:CRP-like cAMP-binding protein
MIDRHLARLRVRHEISVEEERAIRASISEIRSYEAGETIIRAGELLNHSVLLIDGLLCRYKDLENGQRQIAELHVPGDFADLHSYSLKRLDHNVMTLTACRAAMVPHSNIKRTITDYPHLADVYWFSTNLDAAIHREWVLSLGRRSAVSRMTALFCELQVRFALVGMADKAGFALEINQVELAECLGLTPVHVNRTLKQLREQQLVTFRNKRVSIHDWAGLQALAEFDPAYLYLERQPRPA